MSLPYKGGGLKQMRRYTLEDDDEPVDNSKSHVSEEEMAHLVLEARNWDDEDDMDASEWFIDTLEGEIPTEKIEQVKTGIITHRDQSALFQYIQGILDKKKIISPPKTNEFTTQPRWATKKTKKAHE